jgi:DNA repair protein RecN (Recombination protein N)
MLVSMAIRDVVLIDRLDLSFDNGLCVLTGETGAGKSILLDALGLALGSRADARLLRPGAERAVVSAVFEVPPGHSALALLAEQGLEPEGGLLVLRRTLGADGRSRGFINDQPVSIALLRDLGDSLIEVQGQFEQRGLLDGATHRGLLDAYAGSARSTACSTGRVAELWQAWRVALEARAEAERELEHSRRDEDFLRHAVSELDTLQPRPGEAEALAEQRNLLQHREKLIDAMAEAVASLSGGGGYSGAEETLGSARRVLERAADKAGGRLEPVLAALERAAAETEEALALIQSLSADMELDTGRLEQVEERFFALKDLARKHGTEVDALADLRELLAARLAGIDSGAERLAELERQNAAARDLYLAAADELSQRRRDAAQTLDRAVNTELPPLKLEKAIFRTRVERLTEADWGAGGLDRIAFEAVTNPGAPPGPLGRIASGGELSRFLLALKVVLAQVGPAKTLVFDEVDSGVGGATAHAVGERLARLARDRQVLVVTHSPQVAARAAYHWRVRKEPEGERLATRVGRVSAEERREEIARMLSGAEVTDEARAAADRLMGAA